ncbi:MAG: cytochrome c oxidase subunit II [Bacteroidia bacterium]|nr:cytochrome c oxidase subunit II [Bacteroidia bacterium]MCX7652187.1 cytochrome c oxidase subunit II [Bacteroidia bacterium]MDW8416449.1 cytochrome c oxidase subunit II [Bacteroidia bacterium]
MRWLPLMGLLSSALWAQIGAAARARAAELATQTSVQAVDWNSILWKILWIETIVIVIFSIRLINIVVRSTGFDPFASWNRNKVNMRLWLAVGGLGIALAVWGASKYAPLTLPEAASAHGPSIDALRNFTLSFTFPAFIIVHLMLFYMIWRYYNGKVTSAAYEVTNHALERTFLVAISIPVIVIAAWGIYVWSLPVHGQSPTQGQRTLDIEVVAEQFQWRVRYPGNDGKLGRYHYTLIGGENVLGIDFTDPKSQDDLLPALKEIHLPVGALVTIHVRSKDVLHSLYLPHFRSHVYAVPGQKNQVMFVPTITTKEMRRKLGNPEFDYELACNQLCGGAHYNMRMKVVVETWEEYQQWLSQQKPAYTPTVMTERKNLQNS